MASITDYLFVLSFILAVIHLYLKYYYSYWRRRNVVSIDVNYFFGNLKDMVLGKNSPAIHFQNLYNDKMGLNEPYVGTHIFHQPALLLRSPALIKQILTKDSNIFSNGFENSFNNLPKWQRFRSKLNQTFSSANMNQIFGLVNEVGKNLDGHLRSLPIGRQTNSMMVDIKETSDIYTTDVMAKVAFGIDAKSFRHPNNRFRQYIQKLFNTWRGIDFIVGLFIPQLAPLLRWKFQSKESARFLRTTIESSINEREKNGITRDGLIDILFELRKLENDSNILAEQAMLFFSSGFQTTSATMSLGLYELSKQPQLQQKLRMEFKATLDAHKGQLTYDIINNMPYLNMVLQETFRMYPPIPILQRKLSENEKSYSMEPFGDLEMENGISVYIPVYAFNRDPIYFPDPDLFNPERFAIDKMDDILPYTIPPFGGGVHDCNELLAVMQTKIGLLHFLENHQVRPCKQSAKVMDLDRKAFITQPSGGIYCDLIRDPIY